MYFKEKKNMPNNYKRKIFVLIQYKVVFLLGLLANLSEKTYALTN